MKPNPLPGHRDLSRRGRGRRRERERDSETNCSAQRFLAYSRARESFARSPRGPVTRQRDYTYFVSFSPSLCPCITNFTLLKLGLRSLSLSPSRLWKEICKGRAAAAREESPVTIAIKGIAGERERERFDVFIGLLVSLYTIASCNFAERASFFVFPSLSKNIYIYIYLYVSVSFAVARAVYIAVHPKPNAF